MLITEHKKIKVTRKLIKGMIEELIPTKENVKEYKFYQAVNNKKTGRFAGFMHSDVLIRKATEKIKVFGHFMLTNDKYDFEEFKNIRPNAELVLTDELGTFKAVKEKNYVQVKFVSQKFKVPRKLDVYTTELTKESLREKLKDNKNKYKPIGGFL